MKNHLFRVFLVSLLTLMGCSQSIENRETVVRKITPSPIKVEIATIPEQSPSPERLPDLGSAPVESVPSLGVDPNKVYLMERYRGGSFESPHAWQIEFERWIERRPQHPGILNGINGFAIAIKAGKAIEDDSTILNDKWKHCVVGAVVATEVGITTAEFIAWLKEYHDLVDGFRETSFDEIDFDATIDGAVQASNSLCRMCAERCEERWGKRTSHWNGSIPII